MKVYVCFENNLFFFLWDYKFKLIPPLPFIYYENEDSCNCIEPIEIALANFISFRRFIKVRNGVIRPLRLFNIKNLLDFTDLDFINIINAIVI